VITHCCSALPIAAAVESISIIRILELPAM
jgi:hypothetical protein